jgi:two-component system response regulator NreC
MDQSPSIQKTKRILVADDHKIVVQGIVSTLKKHPEFQVIGKASDGMEAIEMAKSLKPDIVIMDISMPNIDGVEAAYQIREENKKIAILVFTMHTDEEYVLSLQRAGISGYVSKNEPMSSLVLALQAVAAGGTYFSEFANKIIHGHMQKLELGKAKKDEEPEDGFARLTRREKEVFLLLAGGKTIKEIAKALGINSKTVETHKYNIMEKLGIQSVTQMTKIAFKKKLIEL